MQMKNNSVVCTFRYWVPAFYFMVCVVLEFSIWTFCYFISSCYCKRH